MCSYNRRGIRYVPLILPHVLNIRIISINDIEIMDYSLYAYVACGRTRSITYAVKFKLNPFIFSFFYFALTFKLP